MAKRIKYIVVHWSVTGPFTTVHEIDRMHKAKGWRMIGYHRFIQHPLATPNAEFWWDLVKQGRPLDTDLFIESNEVAAAVLGHNADTVNICVSGKPGQKLHPLQKDALLKTLDIMVTRFKLSKNDVKGHRDFYATQCPGDEIYKILEEYKRV